MYYSSIRRSNFQGWKKGGAGGWKQDQPAWKWEG